MLAVPYLAGAFGGLLTVRTAPSPAIEAAALRGFACGAVSGCLTGALAALSGGPLGAGRLAVIGPSGWQLALVATLEMGVAAAVAAGIANWLLIRRRRTAASATTSPAASDGGGGADDAGDASGHRIYLNPWADDEDDDQPHPPAAAGSGGTVVPFPVPVDRPSDPPPDR
jgi:hypothetical protein